MMVRFGMSEEADSGQIKGIPMMTRDQPRVKLVNVVFLYLSTAA